MPRAHDKRMRASIPLNTANRVTVASSSNASKFLPASCTPSFDFFDLNDKAEYGRRKAARESARHLTISFSPAYREWDRTGEVREAIFTALNAVWRSGDAPKWIPASNDDAGNIHVSLKSDMRNPRAVVRLALNDEALADVACRAGGIP